MKVNTTLYGTLTLLTHCPLVGAVESLSFVTAINQSFNGEIEDRQPLRDTPKQSMQLSYVAMPNYFDVEYKDIRQKWAVPFDQEMQYVGDVAQDSTSIICDTTASDFRPNSLALLKNSSEFRIIEISAVNSDSLELINAVSAIQNATISPLRVCIIDGDIGRSFNTTYQSSSVTFKVIDTMDLDEQLPILTYKGNDLYFPTIYSSSGALDTTISKQQDIIDYDVGLFSSRSRHTSSRVSKNWNFRTQSTVDLFNFKKFLFRRLGMFRDFYMQTSEPNLKLKSTGVITSYIDVERTNYIERKNIALLVDGNWQAVEVASITQPNSTTTRLNLASSLSIQASSIQLISYLGLYRLNTDTIDISYNGNDFVTTTIPVLELE